MLIALAHDAVGHGERTGQGRQFAVGGADGAGVSRLSGRVPMRSFALMDLVSAGLALDFRAYVAGCSRLRKIGLPVLWRMLTTWRTS